MTTHVRRALVRFFVLTFAISWGLWLPAVIFRDTVPAGLGLALLVLGGLVPSSTAIALTRVTDGRTGIRHLIGRLLTWRSGRQWWLALFLLPALVTLAALVFAHLGGPPVNFGAPILGALIRFPTMIFPGTALGEEIGWRG